MLREQLPDHEKITPQKITRPLRGLHTAADGRPTSKNLPPALEDLCNSLQFCAI